MPPPVDQALPLPVPQPPPFVRAVVQLINELDMPMRPVPQYPNWRVLGLDEEVFGEDVMCLCHTERKYLFLMERAARGYGPSSEYTSSVEDWYGEPIPPGLTGRKMIDDTVTDKSLILYRYTPGWYPVEDPAEPVRYGDLMVTRGRTIEHCLENPERYVFGGSFSRRGELYHPFLSVRMATDDRFPPAPNIYRRSSLRYWAPERDVVWAQFQKKPPVGILMPARDRQPPAPRQYEPHPIFSTPLTPP